MLRDSIKHVPSPNGMDTDRLHWEHYEKISSFYHRERVGVEFSQDSRQLFNWYTITELNYFLEKFFLSLKVV